MTFFERPVYTLFVNALSLENIQVNIGGGQLKQRRNMFVKKQK